MAKKNPFLGKILVIEIIFLFVVMSITPSVAVDTVKKSSIPIFDKTAYAWREFQRGPCYFKLNDPGNITQLGTIMGATFLSGGTWTNDGRWLGVDMYSGSLWEVKTDGELIHLGGGGNELTGLAYNPINSKLYGAGDFSLYEIDIDTGEHTYIGDYGEGPEYMLGIAFDLNGVLYGWDRINDSLWNINTETGQASLIVPLDIDINYSGDGHFDFRTDILYLSAFTTSCQLYECDEDTGQCNLVGDFENTHMMTALAIPYNWPNQPPPAPDITVPEKVRRGRLFNVTIRTTDADGDDVYYRHKSNKCTSSWFGPFPSGENYTFKLSIIGSPGIYLLGVQAKDINDAESEWAYAEINLPRRSAITSVRFQWFLERFPLLERLLTFLFL